MPQRFTLYGVKVKRFSSVNLSEKSVKQEDLRLPCFPDHLETILSKGESLKVDGTNVIRVPFGIREPLRQRPARPNTWATLVLPLQSIDTPTPPPHAA